jgi:type II secretory pathway pseudopilin PulG
VPVVLTPVKGRQDIRKAWPGYCLVELLLALFLLGIFLTTAAVSVGRSVDRQQARGISQVTQAAVARAQTHAVWQGGDASVSLAGGRVLVNCARVNGTDDSGLLSPSATVSANVTRWAIGGGVTFRFLAPFGSPDSGGTLRIESGGAVYKVIVRPESGLTARAWSAE